MTVKQPRRTVHYSSAIGGVAPAVTQREGCSAAPRRPRRAHPRPQAAFWAAWAAAAWSAWPSAIPCAAATCWSAWPAAAWPLPARQPLDLSAAACPPPAAPRPAVQPQPAAAADAAGRRPAPPPAPRQCRPGAKGLHSFRLCSRHNSLQLDRRLSLECRRWSTVHAFADMFERGPLRIPMLSHALMNNRVIGWL